jgi:hypothetical protein
MRTTLLCLSIFLASHVCRSQSSSDTVGLIITQSSKYLVPGQTLRLTIQAIGNRERIKTLSIAGVYVKLDKNGMAVYELTSSGIGTRSVPISIYLNDAHTETKEYEVRYAVGRTIDPSVVEINKETEFEYTLLNVFFGLRKRDSLKLSHYVHKNTGVYILNRIGVYDTYKHYSALGFSDTTYPNVPFYDDAQLARPSYTKVPGFDCGKEKWDHTGTFIDTTQTDHLLSTIAKRLNEVSPGQVDAKSIEAFVALEDKSRRIVLAANEGNELIIYLSYIGDKWYLTMIDKVTCDCSS